MTFDHPELPIPLKGVCAHYLNRHFVALSQKPPKLLCYLKNRQAVALSQKPPKKSRYK
jgi:hypothetical protein